MAMPVQRTELSHIGTYSKWRELGPRGLGVLVTIAAAWYLGPHPSNSQILRDGRTVFLNVFCRWQIAQIFGCAHHMVSVAIAQLCCAAAKVTSQLSDHAVVQKCTYQ